jgi:hypothetical protein
MSAAAASLRCSGAVRCERGGIESSSTGMEVTPLPLREGLGRVATLDAPFDHSPIPLPQGGGVSRREYLCTEGLRLVAAAMLWPHGSRPRPVAE